MENRPAQKLWIIGATFVVAFILAAMPLPTVIEIARPQWISIVLIYWVVALPNRVGIATGFIVGLFNDVLQGSVLGVHALAYSVEAYICFLMYQRLRMYRAMQQALVVLIIIGIGQVIVQTLQSSFTLVNQTFIYLLPSVISAMVWPWVFLMLREVRRSFKVH